MFFCAKTTMSDKTPTDEERDAHRAYLKQKSAQLLAAGPTFDTDSEKPEGSIMLFEAEDWEAAKAFVEDDPFFKAGMRSDIKLFAWHPGGYARTFPIDAKSI
ncbi:YciI family protein [Alterisphingorhabdus coralli]|uniref:YciI family protein n=1 Tax=Alterisphingorhabdus coralli TaxID=3071408 RepID=A0AA97F7G4_9SPHN|nr:YciI family protein [Parasphingorhabdus sp. SCSIO 66989]WOE74662.1 YciI family protein [Parasphingorhabdus sp. SCSIO 66989]